MNIDDLIATYSSQIDTLDQFVTQYGEESAWFEYTRSLIDHYFTDKVNAAISTIRKDLEDRGVSEELIDDIERGFHEQSVEAFVD
jgi:hypothetical protein